MPRVKRPTVACSTLSSRVSLVSPATLSSQDHHHHHVSFTATKQRSHLITHCTSGNSTPAHHNPQETSPPVAGHSLTTSTSPHNPRLTALKNGRRRPLHLPTRRPQGTSLSLLQHHPIPIPSHSVLTSIPKKRRHSSSPPPPPPPPQRPRLALRNADGSLALPRGAPRRSDSSSGGGGAKRRMMGRGRPVRDSDFRGCWEAWKGKGRRG